MGLVSKYEYHLIYDLILSRRKPLPYINQSIDLETFVRKELNFVRNINAVWKVFVFGVILVRIVPHTDWYGEIL